MDNNNSNNRKQKKVSKWLEDARFRKANKKWLGYSGEIAMRILAIIEKDEQLNQRKLSEYLEVSPQYISRIIQGKENLTLETIGKLSEVLQFELITFPPYRYQDTYTPTSETSGKLVSMTRERYNINEAKLIPYNETENLEPCINF